MVELILLPSLKKGVMQLKLSFIPKTLWLWRFLTDASDTLTYIHVVYRSGVTQFQVCHITVFSDFGLIPHAIHGCPLL